MNLVQMLVLQVDIQVRCTSVLSHALLLSRFGFENIYSFLVDLQYRRNSFSHPLAVENTGTDLSIYDEAGDVDLVEAYIGARCQQGG